MAVDSRIYKDELTLVRAMMAGDEPAWRYFEKTYNQLISVTIQSIAWGRDADDLRSEIYLHFLEKKPFEKFDGRNFRRFLRTVIKNKAIDLSGSSMTLAGGGGFGQLDYVETSYRELSIEDFDGRSEEQAAFIKRVVGVKEYLIFELKMIYFYREVSPSSMIVAVEMSGTPAKDLRQRFLGIRNELDMKSATDPAELRVTAAWNRYMLAQSRGADTQALAKSKKDYESACAGRKNSKPGPLATSTAISQSLKVHLQVIDKIWLKLKKSLNPMKFGEADEHV